MDGNWRKKYNPAKQPCRQGSEREDCFARNRMGNCSVLTDTYPCGVCPFYKPCGVFESECRQTYSRLVALERFDLIGKYEMGDQGLSGSWTVRVGRRR